MPIAYVLINAELGREKSLLKALKVIENISEVYMVYGVYDIIVKVKAEKIEDLMKILTFKIRRMKEVRSTLTMTVHEGI